MPLGHLIEASLGAFFSPWFVLFELIVLFVVVPRMVGYWIVSQDQHERYQLPPLLVLFLVASILLWVSISTGLALEPLLLALSLLSSFMHVEMTWRGVRLRERATGSGGVETQRLRSRNYLTYDLGLALALAGVALAFALVDTIGHGLQQWLGESNRTYAEAFAAISAALVALTPIARMAANLFAGDRRRGGPPSTLSRMFKEQIMAGLLALGIDADAVIELRLMNNALAKGKPKFLGTGLKNTKNIEVWTGVRDDPFIFPAFFGTNVVAMVLRIPITCFPDGQRDWIVWATSHEGKRQIDHVGRSLRTQNPRFELLNTLPPAEHAAAVQDEHENPGLLRDLALRLNFQSLFAYRKWDFVPDVMIYTSR